MTSKELFYLIRLIAGDLRIGTTEQVELSALGEAAVKEKKRGTDLETIVAEHRSKPKKLAKKESICFILSINFENRLCWLSVAFPNH